jgi:thiamine biosynthesis lipoprotein
VRTLRFAAMGCPCELQLLARSDVAALAIAEVRRLDAKYTHYRDDSFLAEINRAAAAGGSIEVDPETASLLDYAGACHRESGGRFDVTAGALGRAWRCAGGAVPTPEQLDALRARTGWHRLRWEKPVLSFLTPGMELDLGGVVKEYAVDRVVALCRAEGVRSGLVNLGGDLAAIGPRPDGSPWRIGIQHPRAGGLAGTLQLHDGALATSGDYERCVTIDGQRYGHIVDPLSGWPVRHLASVSVQADLCVVAGSASTIAMLAQEDGPAWLAQVGLPHQWIDVAGTSGGTLYHAEPAARSRGCSRSGSVYPTHHSTRPGPRAARPDGT